MQALQRLSQQRMSVSRVTLRRSIDSSVCDPSGGFGRVEEQARPTSSPAAWTALPGIYH
jgi:hypothetical protein